MTIEEVKQRIMDWNGHIDLFMKVTLPELLEQRGIHIKNDEIALNDYIKALQLIEEQRFYEIGAEAQTELRANGFDVKMDMQNCKLVLY